MYLHIYIYVETFESHELKYFKRSFDHIADENIMPLWQAVDLGRVHIMCLILSLSESDSESEDPANVLYDKLNILLPKRPN